MSKRSQYMKDYRQRKAAEQTPSSKIAAELESSYRESKARLEAALSECKPGTNGHLRHLEALARLDRDYRAERAQRGLDPDNLGTGGRPGWISIAHVGSSGFPSVVEVKPENAKQELANRNRADSDRLRKLTKAGDAEGRAALDKEFGFDADGKD